MQIIDNPRWVLREVFCQCCAGQGTLCLAACPGCKAVVLICDEVGTVYQDLTNLAVAEYGGLDSPDCLCKRCSKVRISEFVNAEVAEIQAAGIAVDSYKRYR